MPTYEYICPRGHVTEKTVRFQDAPGPGRLRCKTHTSITHCDDSGDECNLVALKKTVYRVGVTGDLPTRGSF